MENNDWVRNPDPIPNTTAAYRSAQGYTANYREAQESLVRSLIALHQTAEHLLNSWRENMLTHQEREGWK